MKRTNQSGSTHVIIILVLVLALIATLGWIFYQNFLQGTQKAATNFKECTELKDSVLQESYPEVCVTKGGQRFVNPDQKIDEKDLTLDSCTKHEKICFTYPQTWSYSETSKQFDSGDGTVKRDENELISPDKKVTLTISTGIGQLGGLCPPDDTSGDVQTIETHTVRVSVENAPSDRTKDLYAVKLIVNTNTGKYVPGVLLSSSKLLTQVGTHEECTTGYTDLFTQKNGVDGYSWMRFSSLPFFNVGAESSVHEPAYDTYDEAKAALGSQAYKDAFDVLLSAHY